MKTPFHSYYHSLPAAARTALAKRCKVNRGTLDLIASGHRKAGMDLSLTIERESAGAVRAEHLCKDCRAGWRYVYERAHSLPPVHRKRSKP